MADHSENSMASPPVDRGSASYFEQAKKWLDQACLNAQQSQRCLRHSSVSDTQVLQTNLVAKLHDSDDKKEEEAALEELVERINEIAVNIYKYDPWNHLNYAFQENSISLKCVDDDDVVVLKMNKRAATSQSGVLKDVVDSTGGGRDEIPVPGVTSLILSKIAFFCKKKHKFDTQLNIISELLKCTMDSYKAFVTSFVKDNQSIFSQLHDAANYLDIPNLMELMSRTMRDMKKGSTIDEISDRYSTLSIARILSPLGLSLRYNS